MEDNHPKIKVVIRKRPLTKKELKTNDLDIIYVPNNTTLLIKQPRYHHLIRLKVDLTKYTQQHLFNFDAVFNQLTTNQQVRSFSKLYHHTVKPLVELAFNGAKIACFAYGQTGSGKTYTMLGDNSKNVPGLYLLGGEDIFKLLQKNENKGLSIWISFYEIYCGKLYDLLHERQLLFARQDSKQNVNIIGLEQHTCQSVNQLMSIIDFGNSVRITAQNNVNIDSSRSHAILQISIKHNNNPFGKISFIDLAGSERAADHGFAVKQKQTRIDGAQINKSLLALKECIRALDQKKQHTPFRGSKLTMVLKDSFTGYCKTLMIGTASPGYSCCENTLNTLRYADRVKELKKGKQVGQQLFDNFEKELMLPRKINNLIKPHQYKQQTKKHNNQNYFDLKEKKINLFSHQMEHQKELFSPSKQQKNRFQKQKRQQQMERVLQKQSNLIGLIITQEQQIVQAHKRCVDDTIQLVKQEMNMIEQVEKQGSEIGAYLNSLQGVIEHKMQSMQLLRVRMRALKRHLGEEEQLEKSYYWLQQKNEGYPYECNNNNKLFLS